MNLPNHFQMESNTKPFSAALAKDIVYVQQLITTAIQSAGNLAVWDVAVAAKIEFEAKYGCRQKFATVEAKEVHADFLRRHPYGFEPLLPSSSLSS